MKGVIRSGLGLSPTREGAVAGRVSGPGEPGVVQGESFVDLAAQEQRGGQEQSTRNCRDN